MARSNKLPEGYKSADKLLKEFRAKNPKGKIITSAIISNDGIVVVSARVEDEQGGVGSGIADGDLQEEKSSSKAESAAIRRALLALGLESVESDEEGEDDKKSDEKEEKEEKRSFKRDEPKKEDKDDEESEEEEEKEEKPRSRFGNKGNSDRSEKSEKRRDSEEEEEDEQQEEGKSRFKRGSRFERK